MGKSYGGTKRTDKNSIMSILYFFDKPYWSDFKCNIGELFTNLDFYNPIGHIAKLGAPMYDPAPHKISLEVGNLPLAHAFSNSRQGSVESLYLILSSMHSLQTDSPRKVELPHTNETVVLLKLLMHTHPTTTLH